MRDGKELLIRLRTADEDFLGRFAETVWEHIFRASGVRFIPLARLQMGGAPRIDGSGELIVVPDYQCAAEDWSAYVDSKCKTGPVLWRKLSQWRHGINSSHYDDYKKTGRLFNQHAGLALIELFDKAEESREHARDFNWSGALLVARFKELGEPFYGINERPAKVYWKRKAFTDLDCLMPDELLAAYRGHPPRSYRTELTNTFAPWKQCALFGD